MQCYTCEAMSGFCSDGSVGASWALGHLQEEEHFQFRLVHTVPVVAALESL
ncbi:hypothetical protein [Streptomyces sp. NPDC059080]|uniref:DUF7848 domain-containing protein n=1 Tax=Streptomyces sp. NPDC059080 TaxID=3346718 RepID=UPI0036C6139F